MGIPWPAKGIAQELRFQGEDVLRRLKNRLYLAQGRRDEGWLTERERSKYERMWSDDGYPRGASFHRNRALRFLESGKIVPGSTVVEFGCGAGHASRVFLEHGCRVVAVDIARNALDPDVARAVEFHCTPLWSLPASINGDFGFCTRVMEHIPPAKVDDTLSAIRRAVRDTVIFDISFKDDIYGRKIGEVLHLTVRPRKWWQGALARHWREVTVFAEDEVGKMGIFLVRV